jgi:hypothetical protein
MAKGYSATDVIIGGAVDVSVLFALDQGGLTISGLKLDWVRYDENVGTSFAKPSRGTYPLALTELTNYDDAHADGQAKFIDTDTSGALQRLLRVDFPDAAFATGKMKVVCNVLDDGNNIVGQRIFDLRGNDSAYSNGAVWVSANGTAPSTALNYKHGTPADALNNIGQAKEIADSLEINKFQLVGEKLSAQPYLIDLATSDYSEGYEFISDSVSRIDLGFADIEGCSFKGCHLFDSGTTVDVGTERFQMENCIFGHTTVFYLPRVTAKNCVAYGTIQLNDIGTYEFAGLKTIDDGAVTLDFDSALGASLVTITGFSGKLLVKNMKASDKLRVSGDGEIDFDSTCTDGDAYIAGTILVDPGTSTTAITDSTVFAVIGGGDATLANQTLLLSRLGIPSSDVYTEMAKDATVSKEATAAKDATVAKEANATTNKSVLQGEHSALSAGHAALGAEHTNLLNGQTALGVQNLDIQNRLPTSLQNGRMKSNIDAIGDSATVDGVALSVWAELMQAMMNGRFKKNFPVAGQVTFYKRDNTTVLSVVNVTDTERTRIS